MPNKKVKVKNKKELDLMVEWFKKRFPKSDKEGLNKFIRSISEEK